jgi:hypothetical protein
MKKTLPLRPLPSIENTEFSGWEAWHRVQRSWAIQGLLARSSEANAERPQQLGTGTASLIAEEFIGNGLFCYRERISLVFGTLQRVDIMIQLKPMPS